MENKVKVIVPKDILTRMEVLSTIISPIKPDIGIAILGKGYNHFSKEIVIRIYLLQLNNFTKGYDIKYELQAFLFNEYKKAKDFIEKLPNMSAIEMLIILNSESKE